MIRKGLVLFLGFFLAFVLYSLLGNLEPDLVLLLNTFSIFVLFSAMVYGEVEGAAMGTVAGLLQDAFSHGVFGLSGVSQTITGFLAGWLSRRLNLNTFYKRAVFIFIFSLMQLLIWVTFYFVIFKKSLLYSQPGIYFQPVFTALATSSVIGFYRKITRAA
jgi:rod shape-determining protein MreD